MSSQADGTVAAELGGRRAADGFIVWNRRIHYYLGLYLLFFTWLFAFTGLLLNHPRWQFAQFWPNRVQSTTEHAFQPFEAASDLERARTLIATLGMAGEVQWPAAQPTGGPLTFQVSRPGLIVDVKADPESGRATLQRTELNAWGVMHVLHTFTGVRTGDARNGRDWALTTLWVVSMDAVAVGLMVMVFSSYVMWYRLKAKRRGGVVALLLGFISCGALVAGLRWLT
jgi:hypothetical protein